MPAEAEEVFLPSASPLVARVAAESGKTPLRVLLTLLAMAEHVYRPEALAEYVRGFDAAVDCIDQRRDRLAPAAVATAIAAGSTETAAAAGAPVGPPPPAV